MVKTVLVPLATGFEEIEAITIIDVLRRANLKVITAGVGDDKIEGAHGITVKTDTRLEMIKDLPDAVVLPGGMPGSENLGKSKALQALLQKMEKQEKIIGAICAAPAMALAPSGVLNGRKATCYPGFESKLGTNTKFVSDRVVTDRRVITSRGPGSALEFALAIVSELAGNATATELSDAMLVKS